MARDGSGTYTPPPSTWSPAVAGTAIEVNDWNLLLPDIAEALTDSLAADGQTPATVRIPFALGTDAPHYDVNGAVFLKDGIDHSVLVGETSGVFGLGQSVCIGYHAMVDSGPSLALGYLAHAKNVGCIAIGGSATAGDTTGTGATAIGNGASCSTFTHATALGAGATNTADNQVVLGTATETLSLPGGRIKFPATQVPSSDANTLDDYEEGTWTPFVRFGGGTTGQVYSLQTGLYTKVGRSCSIQWLLAFSAKGSSTGAADLLAPFVIAQTGAWYWCPTGLGGLTSLNPFSPGGANLSATQAGISLTTVINGNAAVIGDGNFTNTSSIAGSATFTV